MGGRCGTEAWFRFLARLTLQRGVIIGLAAGTVDGIGGITVTPGLIAIPSKLFVQ
jgi:hypothetical protein